MILTGIARLGRDAALRYTPAGDPVCNLALAFSHGKKDTSGNRLTQWVEASLWGKQAEILGLYLTKGTQLSVVIQDPAIELYTNRDGSPGNKLVGRILTIEFAGSRPEANPAQTNAPQPKQPTGTAHTTAPIPSASQDTVPSQQAVYAEYDDDIPF